MIDIRNQAGQRLVLAIGQRLTFEESAGWLVDDELPGAFSYPIKFPLEPNEAFLGSMYRPDAARPDMELVVTARLDNILYRRCILSYRVNEGEGDGYLKYDGGEVFSALRKLTLQDALTDQISLGSSLLISLATRMKEIAELPPGQFPCTFFPIRNEGFFETDLSTDKLAGFVRQPYVNAWVKLTPTTYGFKTDSNTVKGYPVAPQFYLTWVLERIFAKANYRTEGDWLADSETQQLVILNQTATTMRFFGSLTNLTHRAQAGQHLPKMTVGDFLKAIRQRYGLQFDFDGNRQVVTIRQFRAIVNSPAQDLTPYLLAENGRIRYSMDPGANRGYVVRDLIDSNDELYHDAQGELIEPAPFVIAGAAGSAEQEQVDLGVGSCQLIDEPSPAASVTTKARWVVPTVRQPGNITDDAYAQTERYPDVSKAGIVSLKSEMKLRIVSYRGMVADSLGVKYPLGTPDVRNGRQEIVGKLSATLGGRYGLWRNVLRPFYFFRDQTRPVTVPLLMPVSAVVGLKRNRPIALKLSGQVRRTYLINKLMAESPGPSGLMAVKLTALSLPDGLGMAADVDEPIVWIELIQINLTNPGTVSAANPQSGRIYAKLTVKCWADAGRTQAAVVSNMPVTLRVKQRDLYDPGGIPGSTYTVTPYRETLRRYYVSGTETVIEANILLAQAYSDDRKLQELRFSFGLDPGDDYNLIR